MAKPCPKGIPSEPLAERRGIAEDADAKGMPSAVFLNF